MPEWPANSMVAGQAEWIWVPRLGRPARSSSRILFGRMASRSSGSGVGGRDPGGGGALGREEATGHGESKDLGGALRDAPWANASIEAGQRVIVHHGGGARELNGPVHDAGRRLGGHGLGHGRLGLDVLRR